MIRFDGPPIVHDTKTNCVEYCVAGRNYKAVAVIDTHRSIAEAMEHMPEDTVWFRFFGRMAGNKPLEPEVDPTGRYYVDARTISLEELRRDFPGRHILIRSAELLPRYSIIVDNQGNPQILNFKDVALARDVALIKGLELTPPLRHAVRG